MLFYRTGRPGLAPGHNAPPTERKGYYEELSDADARPVYIHRGRRKGAALNHDKVANIAVGDKNYQPKAGNKFELGLKTFEKKVGDKKVEYTVVIVTCKAVASETVAEG